MSTFARAFVCTFRTVKARTIKTRVGLTQHRQSQPNPKRIQGASFIVRHSSPKCITASASEWQFHIAHYESRVTNPVFQIACHNMHNIIVKYSICQQGRSQGRYSSAVFTNQPIERSPFCQRDLRHGSKWPCPRSEFPD